MAVFTLGMLLLISGGAVGGDGSDEPVLPQRIVGLDCPLPETALRQMPLTVRCAVAPRLPIEGVFVVYRPSQHQGWTRESYANLEMRKTPTGWYVAEIPASAMAGDALELYFEARNDAGVPVATNGIANAPDMIAVREEPAPEPRSSTCDTEIAYEEIIPARAEWTWWAGVGAGARDVGAGGARAVANLRLGGGVSFGLTHLGFREVRWGPWISGETELDGALGEGGVELLTASESVRTWGALAVRAGVGYGMDRGGNAARISVTLTAGLRSVPARYYTRGPCEHISPAEAEHASVARLFLTARDSVAGAGGVSVIAGVEIDPSLVFGSAR